MRKKPTGRKKSKTRARARPATPTRRDTKTASRQKTVPATKALVPSRPPKEIPVVGIGASAGGLDAFRKFLQKMPPDSALAFVLIPHLDPSHASLMVDLLGRETSMKVLEVTDGMRVEANRVYIIPPNKYMSIKDGTLHLTPPVIKSGVRMPIDHFFRSLAEDQNERAVGIILSGTGTEGVLGLKAIKAAGGLALVQDPATAQHDGMPRNAVATGVVDSILPVEKMPDVLAKYAEHWYVLRSNEPGTQEEGPPGDPAPVLAILRARSGADFKGYKKSMLVRRISRRMSLSHTEKLSEYVARLRNDPAEINALFKDMLIGVTSFFRDPEAWKVFATNVVEPLVREKDPETPIRVWVPGCATGEEAYAIGMLITDQLQATQRSHPIQIFATDIDRGALDSARTGTYPASIAADVPAPYLRRYFVRKDSSYEIVKQVRDTIVFAVQNVIHDPPFSKLDLISCRNLLIYLEPDFQKRILELFHFALGEGGYLFLGNAESLHSTDAFQTLSRKWRIYRRVGPGRDLAEFPIFPRAHPRPSQAQAPVVRAGQNRLAPVAQQILVEVFFASCVLINRKREIVYFYGSTENYLSQPPGGPTVDLLEMTREGLRSRLRRALHEAMTKDRSVSMTNVRVARGNGSRAVDISVIPIKMPKEAEGLYLVAFRENIEAEPEPQRAGVAPKSDDAVIRQIEEELRVAREELQSTTEEMETANEELKAANEEVMSMNEELQSANEELETSKEELQSLNEELTTVNAQLESKITELQAIDDDLSNMLTSTDIAMIFLDPRFRIKRFTAATTKLLNLIPSDLGRPIKDLAQRFVDGDLMQDAEVVLRSLQPVEREVRTEDQRWYIARVRPYRTETNRIDGVVLTFTDITARRRAEAELRSLTASLEQRVEQRTAFAKLLQQVAVIGNDSSSAEQAYRAVLDRICVVLGWSVGHVWARAEAEDGEFIDSGIWFAKASDVGEDWRPPTPTTLPANATLAHRAISSAKPEWSRHASELNACAPPSALGVKFGLACPVVVGKEVVGLLEFFADREVEVVEPMIELMMNVGATMGRVVERQAAQRRRLETEAVETQVAEQRRTSHDLHDGLGQQMTGIAMMARSLQRKLESGSRDVRSEMTELVELIVGAQQQLRSLIRGMHPVELDASGLATALSDLVDRINKQSKVKCLFRSEAPVLVPDNRIATEVYRIAQEATANAIVHAKAKRIVVSLKPGPNGGELEIRDDGVGIEVESGRDDGMGLRIMRYRANLIGAKLEIGPARRGGTVVRCTLPERISHAET